MLRNTFKRGVGIVHGSSNTGEYNKDLFFIFFNEGNYFNCCQGGRSTWSR